MKNKLNHQPKSLKLPFNKFRIKKSYNCDFLLYKSIYFVFSCLTASKWTTHITRLTQILVGKLTIPSFLTEGRMRMQYAGNKNEPESDWRLWNMNPERDRFKETESNLIKINCPCYHHCLLMCKAEAWTATQIIWAWRNMQEVTQCRGWSRVCGCVRRRRDGCTASSTSTICPSFKPGSRE